jgi:GNAT superfamily N-acetyltransferase
MLIATIVTSDEELMQIHRLNQQNLKTNLDQLTQNQEGFVTWLYRIELLKQMHKLSPSIIIKDGKAVAAYALTTLKETRSFHPDLETMFRHLEKVQYKGKPLSSYQFYCMGQICVAREYRGKGLVSRLYQKHKEVYSVQYDFLLTEISASNIRSLKAHEKIGFQTIYTYTDGMDEWKVVVWDWTNSQQPSANSSC